MLSRLKRYYHRGECHQKAKISHDTSTVAKILKLTLLHSLKENTFKDFVFRLGLYRPPFLSLGRPPFGNGGLYRLSRAAESI